MKLPNRLKRTARAFALFFYKIKTNYTWGYDPVVMQLSKEPEPKSPPTT